MKNVILGFVTIVAFVVLVTFVLPAMGLYQIKFWGVKYADANRQVFEHSKSYTHGMIRDLENLKLDYAKAQTQEEKAAILGVARHRAAAFNSAELPVDLQQFIQGK